MKRAIGIAVVVAGLIGGSYWLSANILTDNIVSVPEMSITLTLPARWSCDLTQLRMAIQNSMQLTCNPSKYEGGSSFVVINNDPAPQLEGSDFVFMGSNLASTNGSRLKRSVYRAKLDDRIGKVEYLHVPTAGIAGRSLQMILNFGPGKSFGDANAAVDMGDAIARTITFSDSPCSPQPIVFCPSGSIPTFQSLENMCTKSLGCRRLIP